MGRGGENLANPILALIISFFLPGIGTVYAGKVMMGIVIFIIALILGVLTMYLGIIAYILYIIVWLYGMYDAYTTAKATA
jgi:TM2 domain-containing membrane protein YozV